MAILSLLSSVTDFNPLRGAFPRNIKVTNNVNKIYADNKFPQQEAVDRMFSLGKSLQWGVFQRDIDQHKGNF